MKLWWRLIIVPFALFSSEPHYELGVGTAFISYPSYMGSKNQEQLLLPVPDFEYRSDKTTIDKNGIEQQLFDIKALSLDLSLGGSLPVNSQDAKARTGMPDLDFAFEFGPRLKYQLYQQKGHELTFSLPLRAVLSSDFKSLSYRGYLITPNLKYEYTYEDLKLTLLSGALWSSEKYNDYFYSVAPKYQNSQRESYQAKAGYSGYRNSIGIEHRHGAWHYGGFISHFDLHGVSFEESPLMETKEALFVGSFLSYIFYSN